MNYYNKYLKYKKKYIHLTDGNFGIVNTTDFTQDFFKDNILIQNNTLNINHYKDFDQVFEDHFYTDFKDKIKHINILTPYIIQVELNLLQIIPNLTNLEISYTLADTYPPGGGLLGTRPSVTITHPLLRALPVLPVLPLYKYMIKSNTLKELIISNLNIPIGTVSTSTLLLNTTTSSHLPKLKKIIIKGNCAIMNCISVSENKIEDLPKLEEIIFDKDFDSDINLKNLQELKSIIIEKPNFSKPIKLDTLHKLEKISVTNYTGNITFINMGNFINIFLSN